MKYNKFLNIINIDEHLATPKYMQLCHSIIAAIENGVLKKGESLPSLTDLTYISDISKDTAEKGYKYLKNKGIILSIPRKGYFIGNDSGVKTTKVFLLFNKLSAHKKIIYDSFVAALAENVLIDLYIYNNNFALFKNIIINSRTDYSYYIIIPHFNYGGNEAYELINKIPSRKLILLDKKIPGVEGEYSAIYEDFEKDIYNALLDAKEVLNKYHSLKIVFPKESYFPKEILFGFNKFCEKYSINHEIVYSLDHNQIRKGEAYINLMEDDLIILIDKITSLNFQLGKDVGLISYNETPLKRILLNGITTISTNFKQMGEMAAKIVTDSNMIQLQLPFQLILRNSL